VDKTVQIHRSFDDASQADVAYYRSLTPEERLDILLELVKQGLPRDEAKRRLERVYRIVELARS
jgi:hypothetical protein